MRHVAGGERLADAGGAGLLVAEADQRRARRPRTGRRASSRRVSTVPAARCPKRKFSPTTTVAGSSGTSTRSTKSDGDQAANSRVKSMTSTWSAPACVSSSIRASREVRSIGPTSGRSTDTGCGQKVTTTSGRPGLAAPGLGEHLTMAGVHPVEVADDDDCCAHVHLSRHARRAPNHLTPTRVRPSTASGIAVPSAPGRYSASSRSSCTSAVGSAGTVEVERPPEADVAGLVRVHLDDGEARGGRPPPGRSAAARASPARPSASSATRSRPNAPDAGAAQRGQVATDAERGPEVAGQRPDVGAGRAVDDHVDVEHRQGSSAQPARQGGRRGRRTGSRSPRGP